MSGIDLSKIKGSGEFEDFCDQLLTSEYEKYESVRGSDDGLDGFIGKFNGDIKKGWQFKFFLGGISKRGRKSQIKKSLKKALDKHNIKEWILVLPEKFTKKEQIWFQQLKKETPNTNLLCWNDKKLKSLAQKHEHVRLQFFKGEVIAKIVVKELKKHGLFQEGELLSPRGMQKSIFKLKIFGYSKKDFIDFLSKNLPREIFSGREKEIKEGFTKIHIIKKAGNYNLKIYQEESDIPFQLSYPKKDKIQIWIKDTKETIPSIWLSAFTSSKRLKEYLLICLKNYLPQNTIIEEIKFEDSIEKLVDKKFAHAIDTLARDPDVSEMIRNSLIEKEVNIQISDEVIHSKGGGLPKTNFIQKAFSLIKRKKPKIKYFRARKVTNAIKDKNITIELHRDGRIRIFFSGREDPIEMEFLLNKLVDELSIN